MSVIKEVLNPYPLYYLACGGCEFVMPLAATKEELARPAYPNGPSRRMEWVSWKCTSCRPATKNLGSDQPGL